MPNIIYIPINVVQVCQATCVCTFVLTLQNVHVPWLEMVRSPAVWAIVVAHMSYGFGHYTLLTKLPAFMKEVFQFDIKQVQYNIHNLRA